MKICGVSFKENSKVYDFLINDIIVIKEVR